jgi:transcriptional regulator with XRE-family HTH domain
MHFGEFLKALREAQGLSQNQLAKAILDRKKGKYAYFISRFESGERLPDSRQLAALMDALQLDPTTRE